MKMQDVIKKIAISGVAIASLVGAQVLASNQPQLSQSITDGVKSIDVVDGSGNTVASPSVAFGAATFSYSAQNTTGTLGTSSERIRVSNPTSTATWTASIAGTAPSATWTDGSHTYNFNSATLGQMTVDPSVSTIAGVGGCATTNVNKGSSSAFVSGTTDSITVASGATGAAPYCRWDVTGVGLSQRIPAGQVSGSYNMTMVLSVI